MTDITHKRIIGIDVSRDHLDGYCLSSDRWLRWPNTDVGHHQVVQYASRTDAVVCFEATGGQEWRLWSTLDVAGIQARQLPPAQIKAFASSQGVRAKTDRLDARLIARFLAFRPSAGRQIPAKNIRIIRALTTKRGQLVETRKRLIMQVKTARKQGVEGLVEDMNTQMMELLSQQISHLEQRIEATIADSEALTGRQKILRSVPGVGPVTAALLIAEMPELGLISSGQAAG